MFFRRPKPKTQPDPELQKAREFDRAVSSAARDEMKSTHDRLNSAIERLRERAKGSPIPFRLVKR